MYEKVLLYCVCEGIIVLCMRRYYCMYEKVLLYCVCEGIIVLCM